MTTDRQTAVAHSWADARAVLTALAANDAAAGLGVIQSTAEPRLAMAHLFVMLGGVVPFMDPQVLASALNAADEVEPFDLP